MTAAPYVIVGASLAGLRAAEALRDNGYEGEIVIVGDEQYRPYDRPPLSKAMLSGDLDPAASELPELRPLNAQWRLGCAATGLDVERRAVLLADGKEIAFERLLIATGTRARSWVNEDERDMAGVFALRTRDDVGPLRDRLNATEGRVVIVGAGFIGCEIASALRKTGRDVTVVENGAVPLARALGAPIGQAILQAHLAQGVDLRTSIDVEAFEAGDDGQFRGVRLSDGSVVPGDLCIVALGAERNVEWLDGSGLRTSKRGVHTDDACRVLTENGSVVPHVFAAGDVACWPSRLFDGEELAVEHWSNAVAQARTAARNMALVDEEPVFHDYLPTFWSNQAGVTIKSVGVTSLGDEMIVTQGSIDDGRFVAVYGRKGRIVAALSVDHGRYLDHYARLVREHAPFPPETHTTQPPADATPMSAGFETA